MSKTMAINLIINQGCGKLPAYYTDAAHKMRDVRRSLRATLVMDSHTQIPRIPIDLSYQ